MAGLSGADYATGSLPIDLKSSTVWRDLGKGHAMSVTLNDDVHLAEDFQALPRNPHDDAVASSGCWLAAT
jgi:hypothetical protein